MGTVVYVCNKIRGKPAPAPLLKCLPFYIYPSYFHQHKIAKRDSLYDIADINNQSACSLVVYILYILQLQCVQQFYSARLHRQLSQLSLGKAKRGLCYLHTSASLK